MPIYPSFIRGQKIVSQFLLKSAVSSLDLALRLWMIGTAFDNLYLQMFAQARHCAVEFHALVMLYHERSVVFSINFDFFTTFSSADLFAMAFPLKHTVFTRV